jgi:cytoskeletal protein CcmA (bactofilin family)
MTLTLLVALTFCTLLLPMLPGLREWRRPSDIQPLAIDEADALDPPFLARSFALRLTSAVASGATQLGNTAIAACPAPGIPLPLTDAERGTGASYRLWYADGDLCLPQGIAFYAEVAAKGCLRTADRGVHKALWAGEALRLGARASVLRWAHGNEVFVGESCQLAGRVTAERLLVLAPSARFTLLHAASVQFLPERERPAAVPAAGDGAALAGVAWDALGLRAICPGPLVVPAGTAWHGDLVCHSQLSLGPRCVVDGNLKVRGRLTVGAGCRIGGSVFAEADIVLDEDCRVGGVLMSETAISLGAGCVVGAPGVPVTVAALRITVGAGVLVHGAVWAGDEGLCHVPATALAPAPAATSAERLSQEGTS